MKRIIPEKITITMQYRHKKRCTNCQDIGEMKPLLKQKLKDRLQRTRQTTRNKESRILGLEAIIKLCRHGRKEYLLFLEIKRKKRICNSQPNHSFSFLFLSSRCVFDSFIHCFLIKFLKRYLLSGSFANNYKSRVSIDPCLVT